MISAGISNDCRGIARPLSRYPAKFLDNILISDTRKTAEIHLRYGERGEAEVNPTPSSAAAVCWRTHYVSQQQASLGLLQHTACHVMREEGSVWYAGRCGTPEKELPHTTCQCYTVSCLCFAAATRTVKRTSKHRHVQDPMAQCGASQDYLQGLRAGQARLGSSGCVSEWSHDIESWRSWSASI
jgi:hypothetical protein